MPMVVEALRHVELEARRGRPHHAAASMHAIDLFADAQRIFDARRGERVLVRDEWDASAIGHISIPADGLLSAWLSLDRLARARRFIRPPRNRTAAPPARRFRKSRTRRRSDWQGNGSCRR